MASKSLIEQKSDGKEIKNIKAQGRAVLGCFLRNGQNDGPIFAIVNRHVTKAAKGQFFYDKECKRELAHNINNSSCSLDDLKNDVDLVEITESPEHLVQLVYRNFCGKKRKFNLYEGKVTELKDAEIFQCCKLKKKKQGRVLQMSSAPDSLKDAIDAEHNFIVDDINGEPFATEGDSGRVVAREKDGGIELVGIITWGQYQCHDTTGRYGYFSICMLLKYAIEYLNKQYHYNLRLLGSDTTERIVDDLHDDGGDGNGSDNDVGNDDGGNDSDDNDGGGAIDDEKDDDVNDDGVDGGCNDDICRRGNDDITIEPGQIVFFPFQL